MGQIVGTSTKVKRCNLNAIQTGGSQYNTILADGEYMLVSSDNSMTTTGNGNFDSYILGDGTTSCGSLTVMSIVQTDVTPTADSTNPVQSGGVYSEIKKVTNKTDKLINTIKFDEDGNALNISDSNGNLIAKFDTNGLDVTELKLLKEGELKNILDIIRQSGGVEDIYNDYYDALYITDSNGNVFFKLDSNGMDYYGKGDVYVYGDNGSAITVENNKLKTLPYKHHPLYGKNVYTFGDSLMEGGGWQPYLMQLTGCNWNASLNSLISAGGTWPNDIGGGRGGTTRAKNFVNIDEETYGHKDYLFIESVFGDSNVTESGLNDYIPYLYTQYQDYTAQTFADRTSADEYFSSNFSTVTSIFNEQKPFSIVRMLVGTVSKTLTFSGIASTSGNITVTVGNVSLPTEIEAGDTAQEIAAKINLWGFSTYTGWVNTLSGNVITLTFEGEPGTTQDVVTCDSASLGVTCTIASQSSVSRRAYMFKSNDTSEWNTRAKWGVISENTDMPNTWKGIIEHIQRNCPTTKIYMCLFPCLSFQNDLRPDGSPDIEKMKRNGKLVTSTRNILTVIAKYYNIPIIDIEKELNVMANWSTYYPVNNVHYKSVLYPRVAEIIAKHVLY